MNNRPSLAQVSAWVKELQQKPLELDEVPNPHPEYPQPVSENALDLEPSGVPVWWPLKDPDLVRLSADQRRRSFLNWLAGSLSLRPLTALSADVNFRRQTIAQSLYLTRSEFNPHEFPIRDWL